MWAFLVYIRLPSLSRTFSFLIKTFRLMSSLFWSSNFISLTQAFHFVKKFFQTLFSIHLVFCADLSAATQLEYHKSIILSSTFFFRSVLFSFNWCFRDALSLSAWIEYTFFITKSTHISAIFLVLSFFIVNRCYFYRNMCNIVVYQTFSHTFLRILSCLVFFVYLSANLLAQKNHQNR